MRHVKWIFVVLLISSLTSFVNKDKPMGGLNVGDIAPDFELQAPSSEQHDFSLSKLKGRYVLLSFWASYDAPSRMCNAALNEAFRTACPDSVEMVSISFDEYESIFKETIRKDQIVTLACFVETEGEASDLYKKYQLGGGFANYLLDENGLIVAKDISAKELIAYLN
ncbi:MAG TPA: TlpA family protein disulfide reductase [Candidatus Bacteroides merdigallinarum]|uniref:TlpA family protein disulfide reductase n=1 Tax=Candidatus Bacteroides merdigallinarum TaxID=2838473 RepID=A0A9D2J219_9BACE|nr:TlpA family protein disulfide reductase [Candidatus Bacteroides merdigallinarum]